MTLTQILWSVVRSKGTTADINFGDHSPSFDLAGFKAVDPLSHRWRTFGTNGSLPSEVIERLESYTPALHHLSVQALEREAHINLGEGPPVEPLPLYYATILGIPIVSVDYVARSLLTPRKRMRFRYSRSLESSDPQG
ncbi:hypothetical protein FRB95_008708 [Tulasnella sp. JGI-2019a]|nr:hypothetical protein FRB95_008708 [Tulasnella sp. JGI-2019a]